MSDSPFLTGNFAPVADELAVDGLPVQGRLPAELRGTLFRNGPNPRFTPVAPYHWFTGDGMVHAITLGDGGAKYRNRWVRTPRFLAEEAAGAPLFAGFGQPLSAAAGALDTGVANTHVIRHAERLLALEEAHPPTRLDPGDLLTLGYEDFGSLSGRFTAHPKHDPATGQLVFFSYAADSPASPGPFSRGMSWGAIDADGRVSQHELFDSPYCSMVHDFGVTASHVVLPVLPLTGSLDRAKSGRPPFAWDPACGSFLGVMRRDRGAASLVWTRFDTCFAFHVMNAFDAPGAGAGAASDGTIDGIVMDVVEYDSAPLFPRADGQPPAATPSRLCRWRVDPAGQAPVRREVLDDLPGEFPRIDERRAGLPYRHGFRICQVDGADAVVHHDLDRRSRSLFTLPAGDRASEAVFVPRAANAPEGDGWLLTVVWQPQQGGSALFVLDAQALDQGPVAVVPLPQRVPFGFHGSWVPAS